MKIRIFNKLIIVILCTPLILACDPMVGIETVELPDGKVNENYLAEIETSIYYYLNDDYYPRVVVMTKGELPDGLQYDMQENTGIIHGIPIESGEFEITVEAYSKKLNQDLISSEEGKLYSGYASDLKKFIITIE